MSANPQNSQQKYDWTVMVYLAGDNNLREESLWAIKEMKTVAVGPKVAVLALYDPGLGIPPQYYVINEFTKSGDKDGRLLTEARLIEVDGSVPHGMGKDLIRESELIKIDDQGPRGAEGPPANGSTKDSRRILKRIDTGRPETLAAFIRFGIDRYWAKHHMLVLAGHGSGADQDFLLKDDGAQNSLTIKELHKVLSTVTTEKEIKDKLSRNGGKIDILGFDSCLMSMAEVLYELRESVNYFVGAEGFEPNTGWPYERILRELVAKSNKNSVVEPEDLAKMVVEKYVQYYFDYAWAGRSVDLAACHLGKPKNSDSGDEKSNALVKAVKKLAAVLDTALNKEYQSNAPRQITDAVVMAHWEAQTYKFDQYVDLYDFCRRLRLRCAPVEPQCTEVIKAIEGDEEKKIERIVVLSGYSGPAFQHSHGLSIYFPWANVSTEYRDVGFAKDTRDESGEGGKIGWYEFLKTYVKTTRREQRDQCIRTTNLVENALFNPQSDGTLTSDITAPSEIRFTAGVDRFTAGVDRGLGGKAGYMKNPPTGWGRSEVLEKLAKPRKDKTQSVPTRRPVTPGESDETVRYDFRKIGSLKVKSSTDQNGKPKAAASRKSRASKGRNAHQISPP